MKSAPLAIILLTTTLSVSTTAFAQTAKTDKQKIDAGKKDFEIQCAVCHGMDAKGNGPFVTSLKVAPTDLTLLAKKNGGVFPADRMMSVIDGRADIASHGPRDMPIWGTRYAINAAAHFVDVPYDEEAYVRANVLLLVDYLNRIQQK